tara:strand:+ start:1617 stop:1913 length:297 start_codon:yes stop_codon:yes gene_type:complete
MAKIEQGKLCPLIGEDCRGLECAWYTKISGCHPQTGEEVEEWGCAVAWIPFLQVDNAKAINQTGAAIESLRNETVDRFTPSIELQKLPIQINENFDNT